MKSPPSPPSSQQQANLKPPLPIQQQNGQQQPNQKQPKPFTSIPAPTPGLPPSHTLPPQFTVQYALGPCLGSGGFGFVCTAVRLSDGEEVAVKFILKEKVPPKAWVRDNTQGEEGKVVPMEVFILKNVSHPNIIKYLDCFQDNLYFIMITEIHGGQWNREDTADSIKNKQMQQSGGVPSLTASSSISSSSSSSSTRESSGSLSTTNHPFPNQLASPPPTPLSPTTRRSSCDLFECIEFFQKFNEPTARHVFRQIVNAVAYLQSLGILHRDIKDENILIDSSFNVKLIDFGSASFLTQSDGLFLGTLQYAAPEILEGKAHRGPECEVWSLGCCLYIMLAGESPFETLNDVRFSQPARMRGTGLSRDCGELIGWMLEKDPKRRCTVGQVMRHPWFTNPN
ncbi:hypothetical protein HDV05_008080 [Chytridiales sp. JEL 0842]|nr:hypothetical protein HDV05_008080 [Chytridiales sp. JEL 0842]